MRITAPLLSTTLTSLILAVGCGSGAPSASDIRDALDNPTGSVNDKGGVTAATQRQQSGGSSSSVGSVNPFGGGALTYHGKDRHRAALDPILPLKPFFDHVERRVARSVSIQRLSTAQAELDGFDQCFEQAFKEAAISGVNDDSFSASIEIDFDACGDGTITGKMSLDMSGEIDTKTGELSLEASYDYSNLCIKSGDESVCQNGVMEMTATGQAPAPGSAETELTMEMLAGWRFDIAVTTAGKSYAFTNKGGLEMKIGSSGTGSFRMVAYVTLPDGEEVTYTFTIEVDTSSGSFEIAGKDGKLTCTVDADGNGMCTGTLDLSWTSEEWDEAYGAYGG